MEDLFHKKLDKVSIGSCCRPGDLWTRDRRHFEANDLTDLANEMNELSFEERELVFDEIHGVAKSQEETPKFLAEALEEFDLALSQLFKHKRKALDRALFLRPSIQTDRKFKLLFMRADYFNAAKAARRMAQYFEHKLMLWGEERLVKRITQEDVTDEEIELGANLIRVLRQKDRSGRPMHLACPNKVDFNAPIKTLLRGAWYQTMSLMEEDEAASTKGICQVLYSPGPIIKAESLSRVAQFSLEAGDVISCLPIRFNSCHICYHNAALTMLLAAMQQGLGKQLRIRIRTHFGSQIEIKYSLLTFGIDFDDIHNTYEEIIDADVVRHHREKDEQRQERSRWEQETLSGVIEYPNPNDVLIGRGHFFLSHSGNRRYHVLVESKLEEYNECNNRYHKTSMSTDIVKAIQEAGGRFLSPTNGGWKEMDDRIAREKTAVAFRSFKKRAKS